MKYVLSQKKVRTRFQGDTRVTSEVTPDEISQQQRRTYPNNSASGHAMPGKYRTHDMTQRWFTVQCPVPTHAAGVAGHMCHMHDRSSATARHTHPGTVVLVLYVRHWRPRSEDLTSRSVTVLHFSRPQRTTPPDASRSGSTARAIQPGTK